MSASDAVVETAVSLLSGLEFKAHAAARTSTAARITIVVTLVPFLKLTIFITLFLTSALQKAFLLNPKGVTIYFLLLLLPALA